MLRPGVTDPLERITNLQEEIRTLKQIYTQPDGSYSKDPHAVELFLVKYKELRSLQRSFKSKSQAA